MNNRITVLWLAGLSVYVSYVANDVYRVLRNVETGQYYTLKYMEKSAPILSKLKRSALLSGQSKAQAESND